jgi:hypothetical protein
LIVIVSLELTHYQLRNYMRSFASFHGINSNDDNCNISYDTRVELVEKNFDIGGQEHGWTEVRIAQLLLVLPVTYSGSQQFDAVVVATGRFNAPYIPPISGLSEWSKRFPGRISHSRQYRRPEPYTNETILIVGAAVSPWIFVGECQGRIDLTWFSGLILRLVEGKFLEI